MYATSYGMFDILVCVYGVFSHQRISWSQNIQWKDLKIDVCCADYSKCFWFRYTLFIWLYVKKRY